MMLTGRLKSHQLHHGLKFLRLPELAQVQYSLVFLITMVLHVQQHLVLLELELQKQNMLQSISRAMVSRLMSGRHTLSLMLVRDNKYVLVQL
jgi:hypothetical protein